jgi:hypothetical protein
MRHYLCPHCLHVIRSERHGPFDWCTQCGHPLDAVSLLTDSVPLSQHASVKSLERRTRFSRSERSETSAATR